MRKIRFVKVVIPEIASIQFDGTGIDIHNVASDYKCPNCKAHIEKDFFCCPYCKAEFDWKAKTNSDSLWSNRTRFAYDVYDYKK